MTVKETSPEDVAKQLDDLEQKIETRLNEIYQLLREIKRSLTAGERNDE